jgi:hypothetical protein
MKFRIVAFVPSKSVLDKLKNTGYHEGYTFDADELKEVQLTLLENGLKVGLIENTEDYIVFVDDHFFKQR